MYEKYKHTNRFAGSPSMLRFVPRYSGTPTNAERRYNEYPRLLFRSSLLPIYRLVRRYRGMEGLPAYKSMNQEHQFAL